MKTEKEIKEELKRSEEKQLQEIHYRRPKAFSPRSAGYVKALKWVLKEMKTKIGCGGSLEYSDLKCGNLDDFKKPVYCDDCQTIRFDLLELKSEEKK